jgi:hypothetical protein
MRALTGHILVSIRILGLPSADRMVHRLFPRGERTRQVFPDTLLSLAGVPQVGNVGEKGDLEDDLGGRVRDGSVVKDGTFPRGLGSKDGWVEERMGENFGNLQEFDYNRPPCSDSLSFVDFRRKLTVYLRSGSPRNIFQINSPAEPGSLVILNSISPLRILFSITSSVSSVRSRMNG